jgi:lipopolysaccharide/colanic/teichoic acid biosynthesis glycosyltransferase
MLTSPVVIWFLNNKIKFLKNISGVITGKKSWVGYVHSATNISTLPELRKGILSPADMFCKNSIDTEMNNRLNILYARDYSILTDAEILIKGWKNMDG